MRGPSDPLALDPLGPTGTGAGVDISLTADPLALEPLSPLIPEARGSEAGGCSTPDPRPDDTRED